MTPPPIPPRGHSLALRLEVPDRSYPPTGRPNSRAGATPGTRCVSSTCPGRSPEIGGLGAGPCPVDPRFPQLDPGPVAPRREPKSDQAGGLAGLEGGLGPSEEPGRVEGRGGDRL